MYLNIIKVRVNWEPEKWDLCGVVFLFLSVIKFNQNTDKWDFR